MAAAGSLRSGRDSPAPGRGLPSYRHGTLQSPCGRFHLPGKKERTQWWARTGSTLREWGNQGLTSREVERGGAQPHSRRHPDHRLSAPRGSALAAQGSGSARRPPPPQHGRPLTAPTLQCAGASQWDPCWRCSRWGAGLLTSPPRIPAAAASSATSFPAATGSAAPASGALPAPSR